MSLYTRLLYSRLQVNNWHNNIKPIFKVSCSSKTSMQNITLHQIQNNSGSVKIGCRNFSTSKSFVGNKTLENFHNKDGMPKSFTLVYRTNFHNYFISVQIVLLLSIWAFVAAGIGGLIESQVPVEERRKKVEAYKKNIRDKEDKERTEKEAIQKEYLDKVDEYAVNRPSLADIVEEDLYVFSIMLGLLVMMSGTLHKLLKTLPVRIYIGKQKHCVGIFHGSLIPGKVTRHDFVAGTLKQYNSKYLSKFWGETVFKDGSGNVMVLMEQFFRRSGDFNYLLGLQPEDYVTDDDGDNDLAEFKKSGSYANKESKRN